MVEGVNVVKKHVKPNPMKGATGGIVDKTMPIHQSNVAIFNPATGKADRVGIKLLRRRQEGSRLQVQRRRDQGLRGPHGKQQAVKGRSRPQHGPSAEQSTARRSFPS